MAKAKKLQNDDTPKIFNIRNMYIVKKMRRDTHNTLRK